MSKPASTSASSMLARSVIRPTLIWSCSHACSSSRPWARVGVSMVSRTSCTRSNSIGSAQPWRWFITSRRLSKAFSYPGGAMFRLRPEVNSKRGVQKWSSTRSSWVCRTQSTSYCVGSSPAKASRSKWSMTSACWSSVGASSAAKLITPARYVHWWRLASIRASVRSGLPRRTSGKGSRVTVIGWPPASRIRSRLSS